MLKLGTHIDIHQQRGLVCSKEDAFAHAHVPLAQRLKRSPCYRVFHNYRYKSSHSILVHLKVVCLKTLYTIGKST